MSYEGPSVANRKLGVFHQKSMIMIDMNIGPIEVSVM